MTLATERRFKTRYPLQLNVSYRMLGPVSRVAGVGKTLNISSSGLLIACQQALHPGARVEITVGWPSLLDSAIPLQLVADGRIVRCQRGLCAIAFSRYQFRTMKRRPLPAAFESPVAADG